ncbi:MAG: hypothetical protein IKQ39_04790 [Oscillospiraceae bacterium]|nr:hypothetical protein [Oscillospiraceae bacterium]
MLSNKTQLRTLITVAVFLIVLMLGMGVIVRRGKGTEHEAYGDDFEAARYPYQQLDMREKELYSALYHGISDFRTEISLPDMFTADEYKKVYLLLATQEPEFFYLDTVYETAAEMERVTMYYSADKNQAAEMTKQMEAAADRILSGISPVLSDDKKLLMIHDGIAEGCVYLDSPNADNAYGCLVEGAAKCEGYAKAFLYVTRRAGLEAMCVPGTTDRGEAHIWNIAKIGGNYYNIDVTWDDDDSYGIETAHACFAVPDQVFSDHLPDKTMFAPPACTDAAKTYYQMYGQVLNDAGRLPEMLRTWCGQRPGNLIEFRCTSGDTFAKARTALQSDPETQQAIAETAGNLSPHIFADEKRAVIVILT